MLFGNSFIYFLILDVIFIDFRERKGGGRERGGERNSDVREKHCCERKIDRLHPTCTLTGDRTTASWVWDSALSN